MGFTRSSFILAIALAFTTLSGCATPEDPKAEKEMETLKKRVTKLENRMRALEGRARGAGAKGAKPGAKGGKPGAKGGKPGAKGGKAPAKGGKAPPKGGKAPAKGGKAGANGAPPPGVPVKVEGTAKAVALSNGKRRFKIPGRAPVGELTVLATFSDAPLAEKGKITIPKDSKGVVIVCDAGGDSCAIK